MSPWQFPISNRAVFAEILPSSWLSQRSSKKKCHRRAAPFHTTSPWTGFAALKYWNGKVVMAARKCSKFWNYSSCKCGSWYSDGDCLQPEWIVFLFTDVGDFNIYFPDSAVARGFALWVLFLFAVSARALAFGESVCLTSLHNGLLLGVLHPSCWSEPETDWERCIPSRLPK